MTITMVRDVDLATMEVCVYKNLRNGLWSVCAVKGADGKGLLVAYADQLYMVGAHAVVKESRRRAIADGAHREVCAWFVGKLAELPAVVRVDMRVTFRPRQCPAFFIADGSDTEVWDANGVYFDRGGNAYLS